MTCVSIELSRKKIYIFKRTRPCADLFVVVCLPKCAANISVLRSQFNR